MLKKKFLQHYTYVAKNRFWGFSPTLIKLNFNRNPQTGTGTTIWTGLHPGQRYSTIQFWLEFFFQIAVHKQHHKHLSRLQKQYKKKRSLWIRIYHSFLCTFNLNKIFKKATKLSDIASNFTRIKKKEKKKKSHFNTSWTSLTINARFSSTVVHSYPGSST